MSIFDKFKLGLNKSSKSLSSGLNDLIFKRKIDKSMLDELEDFLVQSDVGVESAKELKEKFSNIKINPKTSEKHEIYKIFSSSIKHSTFLKNKKVNSLTDEEVLKIREFIDQNYKVEGDLRREVSLNIKRLSDLATYRGSRHKKKLPVRGQRTHSNARTRKGKAIAIAGKKLNPMKK